MSDEQAVTVSDDGLLALIAVQAGEIERLRAENEKLRAATGSLVRSLSGCWYAFEPSLRREMGNTNYHCVKEKMDEVEALLNFRAARAAYLGEKHD